jgi:ribosome-binding factor A
MGTRTEAGNDKGLKSASGGLRRELGGALSLRNTPELIFELEHSIEHGAHIAKILGGLEIPDSEDSEE